MGKLSAVVASATTSGECDKVVISELSPTSDIQVPIAETKFAVHNLRNAMVLRGLGAAASADKASSE